VSKSQIGQDQPNVQAAKLCKIKSIVEAMQAKLLSLDKSIKTQLQNKGIQLDERSVS
jgi:hypothetical protein